jgi:hypothetical protein
VSDLALFLGIYFLGVVVWLAVCGFCRDDIAVIGAPFWPLYLPAGIVWLLGRAIREAMDRRRA